MVCICGINGIKYAENGCICGINGINYAENRCICGINGVKYAGNRCICGINGVKYAGNRCICGINRVKYTGNRCICGINRVKYAGNRCICGINGVKYAGNRCICVINGVKYAGNRCICGINGVKYAGNRCICGINGVKYAGNRCICGINGVKYAGNRCICGINGVKYAGNRCICGINGVKYAGNRCICGINGVKYAGNRCICGINGVKYAGNRCICGINGVKYAGNRCICGINGVKYAGNRCICGINGVKYAGNRCICGINGVKYAGNRCICGINGVKYAGNRCICGINGVKYAGNRNNQEAIYFVLKYKTHSYWLGDRTGFDILRVLYWTKHNMDRRKPYKDPDVDYIGRTDRKNSNESYVPIPYVRDNGEDRSVSSGMAFGNYAISDEYAVEDPHWNMMAYNSKRHWAKANWSEQYVESNSRSDDVNRDEHNYRSKRRHGREDFARPSPRDKKGGNTNIKHSALAVFMVAVVVAIPLLIIFVFRKGSPITEGTIGLELKLSDQFQKGMEDPTSTVFKSTEQELCTEVEQAFTTDDNFPGGTNYVCTLKSLRNGSIIVTFVIIITGSYTIPGNDQYVQTVTTFIGAGGTLGSFTVISGSVVVTSASYTQQGVHTIITTTTSAPTTTTSTPEPTTTTTTPEQTTTTTTPESTTTTTIPEQTTTTTTPESTTTTTTPESTTATTTPESTTTTTTSEQTTTTPEATTTTIIQTEIQLGSSLTSPHGDLLIECNVQYAPNTWNEIKLISTGVSSGIEAVCYANGTTQKDNNSYQLTLHPTGNNVSISLLFPNTTKQCFARSNYTCLLYGNNDVMVETTKYVSIPVTDAAENLEIVGIPTINEGDRYVVNCTGDLAPPSSTLDLYTRTANATSFTKSSVNPLLTSGVVTQSCYLQTTKSYTLIANMNDNGTEMRCEALNSSPGSRTTSGSRTVSVTVSEIQLGSSLTSPYGDLLIECNVQYAPNTWNKIKLISSDVSSGIVAVGYANGTTKEDNNSYQLSFLPVDSNISISLLFPNKTKHCVARRNYTCLLYVNDDTFAETTQYISVPDAVENLEIVGNTMLNEGDRYVVNCTGDLAPSSSTLDLYTRTANATSFTKSSVNPLLTNGVVTQSCYLQTTKSYTLIANMNDNGTEMRCEALNSSPGSRTTSGSRTVSVTVSEIQLGSSLTSPHGDLLIECNVQYAPNTWNKIKLISSDVSSGIVAVGYANGTTKEDNNSYQLSFLPVDSNISISLLFPNKTKHCVARRNYTCLLYVNDDTFAETTQYISVPDAVENLEIVGNTMLNEGDRYVVNCTGDLAPPSSTLDLFTRTATATSFTKSSANPLLTSGVVTQSCYLQTTKSYTLIANMTDNGTEMRCEALNSSPGSRTTSGSRTVSVTVSEIQLGSSLTSPYGDLLIECNVQYAPNTWNKIKLISSDVSSGIVAVAYANGTTKEDNNSYQLSFLPVDSNISISLLLPNKTKHCVARRNYTCLLYVNDDTFAETTQYISVPDAAENLEIVGNTMLNEGDRYVVNCTGDLAPPSSTLDLYARTANATSFTKSSANPLVTSGVVTQSCYLQTTKSYTLIANMTDNGTEMRCEALNSSPGSRTTSGSRTVSVTVSEIQLGSSLTSPHGDLLIECNVQYAPNTWNEIKLISSDVSARIVAVGYVNGTTQKDNNSYQLTFQHSDRNMSISLLFPNTTKHCFGRSNYRCLLNSDSDDIIVETTENVSIPVVDTAEHVVIVGNTTWNEGDRYVVNCTGDLAPPSSTLDLYTRTTNATSFTKSSVNPLVTIDGVTESCYLQTTKSYTFIADRTDNGTELRCEALNTSSGTSMSTRQSIVVRVAEMEMNDSITTPEEEITISCNVRYAPSGWDNFSIVSVNNDEIHVTAFSDGTIQQGNSSYTTRLQQSSPDMILSVLFLNTTTHCYARGSYVCTLTDNGIIVINNTATVIITDIASNVTLEGNGTVDEGDRYEMRCSGRVATEGGDLHLHVRSGNTSDFIRTTEVPIVTVGDVNDMCYQSITKSYGFIAERVQNGTEFACVATNVKLSSYQSTTSIDMVVDFAAFNTQFHLQNTTWIPAYGDKNSPEFKSFAEKIENDTDYVYERSNIKDNYKRSKVIGLEQGSVNVIFVMHIVVQVVLTDSSGNVITTKLTPTDIVSAFVDTLPTVANDLTSSDLIDLDTNNIVTDVIIDPGNEYECSNTRTDVVFLLDASGSVGSSNFVLMKFFIKNITAKILLGPTAIQVSVVTFASVPRYEFWLNEHYGALTLNPAIDSIVYTNAGTYIASGLQYVRDYALVTANGARADSEKVVILMTDGQSFDNSATIANTLRNDSVLVACVGIGTGINTVQLNEIAYNSSYIFNATSFNVLTQISDTVRRSTCDPPNND
ncbi:mucin-22-like [Mizuhopecten yessoensis]|uniref:mucin-22-like n=1 Tax=Mizuhopecten yessoensis TaxID=6573 RepID=UPI000B45CB22|nr:mucin-22-like [Mizuhopecten yessoensis]